MIQQKRKQKKWHEETLEELRVKIVSSHAQAVTRLQARFLLSQKNMQETMMLVVPVCNPAS